MSSLISSFLRRAARMRFILISAAVVAAGLLAVASQGGKPAATGPAWTRSEIFFGRNVPGGGLVSEAQFNEFLKDTVTRFFPLGMTVYDAYGQMKDPAGAIVRQDTRVVLLVHPAGGPEEKALQEIITVYRSRFGKPQVMALQTRTEPRFWAD